MYHGGYVAVPYFTPAVFNITKSVLGRRFSTEVPVQDLVQDEDIDRIIELTVMAIKNGQIRPPESMSFSFIKEECQEAVFRLFKYSKMFNCNNEPVFLVDADYPDFVLLEYSKMLATMEEGSKDYVDLQQILINRRGEIHRHLSFKLSKLKRKKSDDYLL